MRAFLTNHGGCVTDAMIEVSIRARDDYPGYRVSALLSRFTSPSASVAANVRARRTLVEEVAIESGSLNSMRLKGSGISVSVSWYVATVLACPACRATSFISTSHAREQWISTG